MLAGDHTMENHPVRTPLTLCLALAVTAAFLVTAGDAGAANRRGAKAPDIAISDGIHGVTAKTTLANYKGDVTLLVIWLPICPHCQKFMPTVHTLHKKYAAKGLKVLTVTHGKKDYTRKYMAQRKWTFGTGFDYTGVTAKRYGMKRMPGYYLIGADGHLRSYTGTLEAAIVTELNAKKKTP